MLARSSAANRNLSSVKRVRNQKCSRSTTSQKRNAHFWLRAECKPLEKRTILMPEHVDMLVKKGHQVTVERSSQRCVPIEKYSAIKGVEIADEGSWVDAPLDSVILGLKELPDDVPLLKHQHVYFAHVYKNQFGHETILKRFLDGGGELFDLEFLIKDGRRVAAFGEAAGSAGTALGILSYIWNKANPKLVKEGKGLPSVADKAWDTSADMAKYVYDEAKKANVELPSIHIIGALGQVGTGSRKMAELCKIPKEKIELWDIQETKQHQGPYPEILKADLFVNCINLREKGLVFLDEKTIKSPSRRLTVISDVSCDYTNPANPIPIYSKGTSFANPTTRIIKGENPLDVIAIDYLPTLIPVESSQGFGDKMLPHLLQFNNSIVWSGALDLFKEKLKIVSN